MESSLLIMATTDLKKCSQYYCQKIGFKAVEYLDSSTPHICLYRGKVEIVLIPSKLERIIPNRELHGTGYDGYIITNDGLDLFNEFQDKGVQFAKELTHTDYNNQEFVIQDIEGRWIAFGIKQRG